MVTILLKNDISGMFVVPEKEKEIGIGYFKISDEDDIRFLEVDIQKRMLSSRSGPSGGWRL